MSGKKKKKADVTCHLSGPTLTGQRSKKGQITTSNDKKETH